MKNDGLAKGEALPLHISFFQQLFGFLPSGLPEMLLPKHVELSVCEPLFICRTASSKASQT